MPAEDSQRATVRTPDVCELSKAPLAGLFGERQETTKLYLDRKIPSRPDVGPTFGKK